MTQEQTGGHIMAEAYEMYDKWVDEFKAAAENSNLEIDVDGLDLIMLIFIYNRECRAVEVAEEEAQAGLARAREAALLEATKAQCPYCAKGRKGGLNYEGIYKHEDINGYLAADCYADDIVPLMAQEKTAGATDGQEGVEK